MVKDFATNDFALTKGMKTALIISAVFHVAILVIGTLGLPYISKQEILPPAPIAVEIVNVADMTTTDKKPNPIKPPPAEKPKEAKKVEKPVEAPPKVDVKEPPKIKPLVKPKEKVETKKPEPKTPPPPTEKLEKVEEKPKEKEPEKKEAAAAEDPLQSLMKNLQESDPESVGESEDEGAEEEAPDAPMAEYVTQNELSALTNQLVGCWQIPIGAKDVNDMVVKVRIWANADRTVRKVEVADQWRMSNDPAFRALAESAKRAVFDPYCSPLNIPESKYNVWKDQYIEVPFDPRNVT